MLRQKVESLAMELREQEEAPKILLIEHKEKEMKQLTGLRIKLMSMQMKTNLEKILRTRPDATQERQETSMMKLKARQETNIMRSRARLKNMQENLEISMKTPKIELDSMLEMQKTKQRIMSLIEMT